MKELSLYIVFDEKGQSRGVWMLVGWRYKQSVLLIIHIGHSCCYAKTTSDLTDCHTCNIKPKLRFQNNRLKGFGPWSENQEWAPFNTIQYFSKSFKILSLAYYNSYIVMLILWIIMGPPQYYYLLCDTPAQWKNAVFTYCLYLTDSLSKTALYRK